MKYRNRTIYTFGELAKMGINENTLNQMFYGRDMKKVGVRKKKMKIVKTVSYITQESFDRYFKHLLEKESYNNKSVDNV